MDKKWIIEQTDFSDPGKIGLMESLFTTGNGYLGLRGDFPLCSGILEKGTYINGFYESGSITYGEKAFGYADNWQTIVPLPESKDLEIVIDGTRLFGDEGRFLELKRTMNLKESVTRWSFVWESSEGQEFRGTVSQLIPFDNRGSVRYEWTLITPRDAGRVKVVSPLVHEKPAASETDDPRLPGHFDGSTISTEVDITDTENPLLYLKASGSGLTAICTMKTRVSGLDSASSKIESEQEGFVGITEGKQSGPIVIRKTVSYHYGPEKDKERVRKELIGDFSSICEQPTEDLIGKQVSFMADFWKRSDVVIEGDDEAQLSLRFNLFQLLQSTGQDGRRSIAAKGLSGSGYEGHYFWDAETYVLPFFIYTNPAVARSMLAYRISLLDKAESRAEKLSHKGILYPWRTINGEECSAYFPAGTAQYHINSDIALGLSKYLEITGDISILDEGGDRLLAETANFWCDFGTMVEGKGFCFHDVTGPDEYTALVDNNYYTNLSVRENLKAASYWLKNRAPDEKISFWSDLARKIYLPPLGSVTPQDDSFLEKEPWDFAGTADDEYPLLLHFHPLNIYRRQVLKQADVVMAQALFPSALPIEQKKLNFDYYEQLTTRDSSLSACAQGINAFWLGYDELAWEYFNETLHTDRKDLHGNVSHGLHTASMGGSYLMIINGFLNLVNREGSVELDPSLPSELDRIKLNLTINGKMLQVDLTDHAVRYQGMEGTVMLFHRGEKITLGPGEVKAFELLPRAPQEFKLFRPRT